MLAYMYEGLGLSTFQYRHKLANITFFILVSCMNSELPITETETVQKKKHN
jgi:hypothetical protein